MARKEIEEALEELEEEIEDTEAGGNGQRANISQEEVDKFEEQEEDRHIPGKGHLFHVKNKHLHESARLNKQMIFGFAARDMQQAVLDPNRTESAWDTFKNRFMGYTISEDGEGRKESIVMHQLTAEEKEAAAQGGVFGRDA